MRDEGSKEEGKDSKGDCNAMVTAAMDGATVMRIDGNGGDGRRYGTIAAQTTINMWQGYEVWASALMPLGVCVLTWSPEREGHLSNVRTLESSDSCPPPLDTDY
jgi:hypothetical protein